MRAMAEHRPLTVKLREVVADRGYVEQPGEGVPPKALRASTAPVLGPPPSRPPPERETTRVAPVVALPPPPPPPANDAPAPSTPRKSPYPQAFKLKAVQLVLERGEQKSVAAELGVSKSIISRWVGSLAPKKKRENMPAKKKAKTRPDGNPSRSPYPQSVREEAVRRVLASGNHRGDAARVAREMNLPGSAVNNWLHVAQHGNAPPASVRGNGTTTMLSNGSSNGAHAKPTPPPLLAMMPGFEEYIGALVDARLKRLLSGGA